MNQIPNNPDNSSAISYDEALEELQNTLKELENQNFSLDKLLQSTQKAKQLITDCKSRLRAIQDGIGKTL
ncbi:MAG: exodeoxyribonuclease VII small subunit [Aureispira sp.]|nr:exodeoxyribonuclease VII small subunit [Aureispira sp.]